MSRIGRVVIPSFPHHIVQRGHNKQAVFASNSDYLQYLETLAEFKFVYGVKVYGFCLMTNHVHIILQPGEKVEGLGLLMKRLAGRQTRWINKQEGRSGSLWEGRYKSSPIQTDQYLLSCCRYIELNPVRARMVESPNKYRWSSYRWRTGESTEFSWLDNDPCFESLGNSRSNRIRNYVEFVHSVIPEGEWELIRTSVQRGQLTGNERFIAQVDAILGRRIEHRKQGRPKKTEK